jgi:hypothetical protein
LKIGRGKLREGKSLDKVAMLVVFFILLISFSVLATSSLEQSLYQYYASARNFPDGIIYHCIRTYDGNVMFDNVPWKNSFSLGPPCLDEPNFYATSQRQISLSVPGVGFYPIYKTQSDLLLTNQSSTSNVVSQSNVTFPLEVYGDDSALHLRLQAALVSGRLPDSQTIEYQGLINDYVANIQGIHVNDSLTIQAVYLDKPSTPPLCSILSTGCSPPSVNPSIFSKRVRIVGILSESKLDSQFNILGAPVFTAADHWLLLTAISLGVKPALGYCRSLQNGLPLPFEFSNLTWRYWYVHLQDFCSEWPHHFAIFSTNLMQDLYGYQELGPSETLFSFAALSQSPSELLGMMTQLGHQLIAGYSMSLLWRSNVVLLEGIPQVSSNSITFSPGVQYRFQNASQIVSSGLSISCSASCDIFLAGVEISAVLQELNTIMEQSQLLTMTAFSMAIVAEVGVFSALKTKFAKEVEIYKANGLTFRQTLSEVMRSHFLFPLWSMSIALIGGGGAIIALSGKPPFLIMAFVLSFSLLIVAEFGVLVTSSFHSRSTRRGFSEKVG